MTTPLRTVIIHDYDYRDPLGGDEILDCGHEVHLSQGFSYAERRRCRKCAAGAPADVNVQWTSLYAAMTRAIAAIDARDPAQARYILTYGLRP